MPLLENVKMADLQDYVMLPTVKAIYDSYEKNTKDWRRDHLGASQIGKSCKRAIWYSFHWASNPEHEGRILRLFERGQNEEAVFVANLRAAGINVFEVDQNTGKQFSYSEYGGHFAGSLDGVANGFNESSATHVLEFKTSSDKAYNELIKKGVQVAKPEHYAQMQVYMAWSQLDRAYYFAVNKNTDAIHGERIKYDEAFTSDLFKKAREIIEAQTPPAKLSEDPAYFECKFCDHFKVCHTGHLPEVNCRTCSHSTPQMTGGWTCENYKVQIPSENQREGCQTHVYQPVYFVPRTVIEYVNNTVIYDDGTKNGQDGFSSESLKELFNNGASEMTQDKFVKELTQDMGATVTKAWKK